jgi:hypothetical protein
MADHVPDVRSLSDQERRLLEKLLRHPVPGSGADVGQLPLVTVVSRCGCGCPTIDLAVAGRMAPPGSPTTILASGEGVSPEGVRFGINLHGREGLISELEVYSITGSTPFTLPEVEDIEVYDDSGKWNV